MREIEKVLKWFDASLEWLIERIARRVEELDGIKRDDQIEESEKTLTPVEKDEKYC